MLAHQDDSDLRRDTRFARIIESSSEQVHNQNICVAVIFVPNFKKEGDIMGELRTKKRGKSWEYSFECARVDGKRKSISKGGFRTKADAIAAGTKAKAEYDNAGVVFRPSDMSLADYLDYWLKSFVKTNCTDNTYDSLSESILSLLLDITSCLRSLLLLFSNG